MRNTNLNGFEFGYTDDGQPGYIEAGADSVSPFKRGPIAYGFIAQHTPGHPITGDQILDESCFSYSRFIDNSGYGYTQFNAIKDMKIHLRVSEGIRGGGGTRRVYKNGNIIASNVAYDDVIVLSKGDYLRFYVATSSTGGCGIGFVIT